LKLSCIVSSTHELIAQALSDRPDVVLERLTQQSQATFAEAERALWFPTISLIGAAGLTPYHQVGLSSPDSAIGVILRSSATIWGSVRSSNSRRRS
jgi:outer membrane protein TolC